MLSVAICPKKASSSEYFGWILKIIFAVYGVCFPSFMEKKENTQQFASTLLCCVILASSHG